MAKVVRQSEVCNEHRNEEIGDRKEDDAEGDCCANTAKVQKRAQDDISPSVIERYESRDHAPSPPLLKIFM